VVSVFVSTYKETVISIVYSLRYNSFWNVTGCLVPDILKQHSGPMFIVIYQHMHK